MRNIGEHMAKVEAKQIRKADRAVKPIIDQAVSSLKAIFDKRRYQRWTTQPWSPKTSRQVRLTLRKDADWRATREALSSHLSPVIASEIASALQIGAIQTAEHTSQTIENVPGMSVDWIYPRQELARIGRLDVGGMSRQEIAKSIVQDLGRKLGMALRRAAAKQSNMMAVRNDFNKRADTAAQAALTSLELVVGDAVTEGQRYALRAFEAPRLSIG
ncbi:MAG: hypothetical protein ACYTEQ_16685 [Planctomycetota bacterium]|jgi:hypothetical protein